MGFDGFCRPTIWITLEILEYNSDKGICEVLGYSYPSSKIARLKCLLYFASNDLLTFLITSSTVSVYFKSSLHLLRL